MNDDERAALLARLRRQMPEPMTSDQGEAVSATMKIGDVEVPIGDVSKAAEKAQASVRAIADQLSAMPLGTFEVSEAEIAIAGEKIREGLAAVGVRPLAISKGTLKSAATSMVFTLTLTREQHERLRRLFGAPLPARRPGQWSEKAREKRRRRKERAADRRFRSEMLAFAATMSNRRTRRAIRALQHEADERELALPSWLLKVIGPRRTP